MAPDQPMRQWFRERWLNAMCLGPTPSEGGVSKQARHVAHVLHAHMQGAQGSVAERSQGFIQRFAAIGSDNTVRKALRELEHSGWIVWEHKGKSSDDPSRFRAVIPSISTPAPSAVVTPAPSAVVTPAPGAGVSGGHPRSFEGSPPQFWAQTPAPSAGQQEEQEISISACAREDGPGGRDDGTRRRTREEDLRSFVRSLGVEDAELLAAIPALIESHSETIRNERQWLAALARNGDLEPKLRLAARASRPAQELRSVGAPRRDPEALLEELVLALGQEEARAFVEEQAEILRCDPGSSYAISQAHATYREMSA